MNWAWKFSSVLILLHSSVEFNGLVSEEEREEEDGQAEVMAASLPFLPAGALGPPCTKSG